MKILLIGYGKMGKAIEEIVSDRYEIVDRISSKNPLTEKAIEKADVCIDFSQPRHVLSHVNMIAPLKVPLVIGTTGWEKDANSIVEEIKKRGSAAIFSPNFSLGVALFVSLLKKAKELFSSYPEYESAGIEWHQSQKLDSPSGTARHIQEVCEFPFTSIRLGNLLPKHEIIFDSLEDTVSISHSAKSRDGYAKGALFAAKWIIGKKGWYTLDDMLYSPNHTV